MGGHTKLHNERERRFTRLLLHHHVDEFVLRGVGVGARQSGARSGAARGAALHCRVGADAHS